VKDRLDVDLLPGLIDSKGLQAELGVSRAAAEAIMRQLPNVNIEGLRKVYVRRADVLELIEKRTFTKDEAPWYPRPGTPTRIADAD
jgi:hypothetical protein